MGVRPDRVCDRVRVRTRAMVRMVQPGQVGAWPRVVPLLSVGWKLVRKH